MFSLFLTTGTKKMLSVIVFSIIFFLSVHYYTKNSISNPIVNENILIIGASQGIGRELSLKLASRKCNIILVARSESSLKALKTELECLNSVQEFHTFKADWANQKDLNLLLEFLTRKFQILNTLILCAGVLSTCTFEQICEIENENIIQNIFNVNSIGPILATRLFLPKLIESKGLIIVLSSSAGVMAAPTRTLYCASKHAVTGFFRALRIEMKPKGK